MGCRTQYPPSPRVKAEHKRQLLTEIAWHFHLQGQRYFAEQEVLTLVADFLPKVRLAPELNSQILTEIANEHGLLKEQIDRSVRQSIGGALGTLIDDEAPIYLLAALLPNSDIADSIHRILWIASRRCHVRIFINGKVGEKQLEVVKW